MQEKIITGRKYGMAVLLGYLALLAADRKSVGRERVF